MILCDEQERFKKDLIRRKQHIVWIPDVWFQWKRDRIAVIHISPLFLPFISLSFICLYFEFLGSNSTPLPLKLEIYFTCIYSMFQSSPAMWALLPVSLLVFQLSTVWTEKRHLHVRAHVLYLWIMISDPTENSELFLYLFKTWLIIKCFISGFTVNLRGHEVALQK